MATRFHQAESALAPLPLRIAVRAVQYPPAGSSIRTAIPAGFLEFLAPLHAALHCGSALFGRSRGGDYALAEAHTGSCPITCHLGATTKMPGGVQLPAWSRISGSEAMDRPAMTPISCERC